MNHAPTTRSSHLSSHLGPIARAAIRAGEAGNVRVLVRLTRRANVDAVSEAARRLKCIVRGYIDDGRLLGLIAPVSALDDLAKVDGVEHLEADVTPR